MQKRVLTAVIGLPLLFLILVLGNYVLFAAILIISSIGLIEYSNAVGRWLEEGINLIFMLLLGAVVIITMKFNYYALITCLISLNFVIILFEIFSQNGNITRAIYTFFGLFYIPVSFGHLMLFETLNNGIYFLWLVFIIAFGTDTAAYFVGMKFGKTKLAEKISPKKTIAGAVGGVVAAALLSLGYGAILNGFFGVNLNLIYYVIIGILGSVVGQCGDLTASMIKRKTGIKDFGKLLPGHGGILDRFDSILFVIPLVYIMAVYTMGIA